LNRDVCGVGMAIYVKIRDEIGFLEFFQKPPGGLRVTTRQHKHQT